MATGNKQTLAQALAAILRGKTMRVVEVATAVRQAGYRTASRNFNTQVNIALTKGPFRRVARGQYTAKGSAGAPASAVAPSGTGTPGRQRRQNGGPGSREI